MDFAQIWVILRGKWALRARGLKGSRAQALSGLEPTRAQARLVQPLVTRKYACDSSESVHDYVIIFQITPAPNCQTHFAQGRH